MTGKGDCVVKESAIREIRVYPASTGMEARARVIQTNSTCDSATRDHCRPGFKAPALPRFRANMTCHP